MRIEHNLDMKQWFGNSSFKCEFISFAARFRSTEILRIFSAAQNLLKTKTKTSENS